MAYTVYSNFSGQVRLPIWSVYKKLEKSGPGQDLYTQIFRGQAGSWSGAYTESSKSQALGEIRILKFSGLEQALDPGRIQKARRAWIRAESVYSNFQDLGRFLLRAYTRYSKKLGTGRTCILKFSGPGQVLG